MVFLYVGVKLKYGDDKCMLVLLGSCFSSYNMVFLFCWMLRGFICIVGNIYVFIFFMVLVDNDGDVKFFIELVNLEQNKLDFVMGFKYVDWGWSCLVVFRV